MNKNRIIGIFILFALLITFAGVSFASSDMDNSHINNDIDEISIGDDLDDINLDDEDWEDYDDEDNLDDEDWEDYDDEDYQYDEHWELLDDYYDSFNKTYFWKNDGGRLIHYVAKDATYTTSRGNSYDENSTDDNCTENETEEFYEEIISCYKCSDIGTAAYSCPLMDDQSENNNQNYYSASEKIDYPDIDYEMSDVKDDENTSMSNDDVSKDISLNKSFDNNILALVAFLIISVLMLL